MTAEGSQIKLLDRGSTGESYDSMDTPFTNPREVSSPKQFLEIQVLDKREERFLQLAKDDNLEGLQQFLQSHPGTDVNAVNYQGHYGLQFAVENQSEEMVEYLLQCPGIHLRDALLFAVREEHAPILVMLLDFQDSQKKSGQLEPPFDSAEFAPHMTPLMLACIENIHPLAIILIQRGHDVHILADDEYKTSAYAEYGETLELGLARIDSYRAVASPTYMILRKEDPIFSAFWFSHKAESLAFTDPIFKDEYSKLSEKCRQFALGMLHQCRTSEEVWVMLRQDHDQKLTETRAGGQYPRLRLAMEYGQKEFITHQNCQQVLQNLWTKNNAELLQMSTLQGFLYFLPRILALPFVYLVYFFFPCIPCFKYWESPIMKFLGDLVSYCLFLSLLLVSIINGEDRPGVRVPDLNSPVDIIIWLWIISYLLDEVKIVYHGGFKVYKKNWWFLYRAIMNLVFLASFITRIANVMIAKDEGYDYKHLPRYLWPWNEPMLVSEALYCVATVLAFIRILYIFQISQVFGPLQLSLSRMISDILQMFVIFFVMIFAFASGLTRLYIYYADSKRMDEDGELVEQQEAFTSWRASFRTLFWGMFGYGDIAYTDVIVDNMCGDDSSISGLNDTLVCNNATYHNFTEGTGYFLYALYHLIMITTLLNMLIGLMANSLSAIQENSDMEWKFARSSIWMQYFERQSFLPNPLNVLPCVQDLIDIGHWCLVKLKNNPDKQAKLSKNQCCYVEYEDAEIQRQKLKDDYKAILRNLLIRYMHKLEDEAYEAAVTQNHLTQLKIDLLKELHHLIPRGSPPGTGGGEKRNLKEKLHDTLKP